MSEIETNNEPRLFSVHRKFDESGISGTGRVLDGVIFHNGQVVICWRSDVNEDKLGFSSLGVYPSWDAFHAIHIAPHPAIKTEVSFSDEECSGRKSAILM